MTPVGRLRGVAARLAAHPLVATGTLIVAVVALAAVCAPWLSASDPNALDFAERLQPPGPRHWLGTDELGRDLWARVLHGARISLLIAVVVVAVAASLGLAIGAVSGFVGGWVDALLMRAVDIVIAIPGLVLAMALTAALGPSLQNAMSALAVVAVPGYVRLARGQARIARHAGYTEAAESFRASPAYLVRVHIVPDCLPVVLVQASLDVGRMILAAAALSFLGLGAQPPTAEWGAMVAAGRQYLLTHWWYSTVPGLAIVVTAGGCTLIGDGLRDWLDPRGTSLR